MKKIACLVLIVSLLSLIILANQNDVFLWEAKFKKVLTDIQDNSIKNGEWSLSEWTNYRNKQLKNLPITDKEIFYKSINQALKDLSDNHSFLIPAECLNQNRQTKNHSFSISEKHGIGYIFLPTLMIDNPNDKDQVLCESWVITFHEELKKILNNVSKGWIIDLTENRGGNIYPMIAAVSYFIKNQIVGGFFSPQDKQKTFINFDGQKFLVHDQELSYNNKFIFSANCLPIVVLIGSNTASSGEALTLVLQRQKETILAGQQTTGLANGNGVIDLPDNLGIIMLTTCYNLDANNEPLFECKINPNVILGEDKSEMIKWAENYLLNKK